MEYILEMKQIKKNFGKVEVLKNVDFTLEKGEVHALLGANGAGKSTLIKILGGVHSPTEGTVWLNGREEFFKNNQESRQKGISVIYQELSLVPTLTVLENMFLGREDVKHGFLKKSDMKQKYEEICREFEFDIPGDTITSKLSIARQQMVEIMKAVSANAEIIVMDEPTTSLTNNEKESLFRIVNKLKNDGKSIIYISHILEEVFRICDRASIMRNGEMAGTYPVKDLTKIEITQLMTGNEEQEMIRRKTSSYAKYDLPPVLEVKNLGRGQVVKDINFCVHKGEVVGLAGLVGSKRTELINLIFGIDKKEKGEIFMKGENVQIKNPGSAISHKIGLIPEDRKHLGLILNHEIYKNAVAVQISKLRKGIFLDKGKELEFTEQGVKKLGIKVNHLKQKVKELSGGNQQKIVVSKWLGKDMDLLIYDEPTKGIDIAAKEDIFQTIEDFSKSGTGVIFISSDLEEVVRVSDRVLVIRNGELNGEIPGGEANVQNIMDRIFDV